MMIGIDLGTTNSLAAVYRNGEAELIPNRLGKYLTPSVVSLEEDGTLLVGETAREYGRLHPLRTVSVFKRSMGTEKEFRLGEKSFSAEELSGMVLRSLKEDAETFLGEPVEEAIISVPAYFNDKQRKATARAGELAGLKVSRIISEPTAAALAHGVGAEDREETCLVFDLGGGTFDISILEFYGSMMEVHAVAGDNYLGGENFTQLLEKLYLDRVGKGNEELTDSARAELHKSAEAAKCAFCEKRTVTVACTLEGDLRAEEFSLSEYETAAKPLLEKLRAPIERSIRDAGLRIEELDRLILVGGATRLPLIRNFAARLFRRFPDTLLDPDTAVAIGAALQCGMKTRQKEIQEMILTDVCPFTLGTEVSVGNGIFEEHGHYLPIIERNTVIPVSRRQTVYTAQDDQKQVCVRVFQGESRLTANNLFLGELTVAVPPGPKGKEAIEIVYTYDINSLLEVEVTVLSTGETRRSIIQNESRKLSEEEAKERLEKLQYLKQNPRDEEKTRLQLLRGERMYEEALGVNRELIEQAMLDFEKVLKRQDRAEIEKARKKLTDFLDELEQED